MAGELFDAGDIKARISVDGTEVDKRIEKANATLASFARDMKKLGRHLTQAITVPLAGIATAAFKFSDEASASFKRFGESTSRSLGKLGTDIARSINLQGILTTISGAINSMVDAFSSLDPVTKRFVLTLGLLSAALGPLLLTAGKFLSIFNAIKLVLLGPFGPAILAATAAIVGLSYVMARLTTTSSDAELQAKSLIDRLREESSAWRDLIDSGKAMAAQTIKIGREIEDLQRGFMRSAGGALKVSPELAKARIPELVKERLGQPLMDIFGRLKVGVQSMGLAVQQGFQERVNVPAKALRDILQDIQNQLAVMPRDWNANEAAVEALRSKYVELMRDGFSASALEPLRAKIQELSDPTKNFIDSINRSTQATNVLKDAWGQFISLLQQTPTLGQQIGTLLYNIWTQFHEGVGQTVAQALVYGQSLAKGFQDFFKRLAATIIATLISIGIQWLILKIIGADFASSQAGKDIGGAAGAAGAWAYAAAVKSQGLIGLATGLGFGAIAIAAALGLGATGIAGGKGVASGMSSSYSGGIFTRPTISAIAERGPEMVLNQKNVRSVFGMGGGGGSYTIEVSLSGENILRYVAQNLPEHLRLYGAA